MDYRDDAVEFAWASERHLRLNFGAADSEQAHARMRQAVAAVKSARVAGLLDITPAFSTILLEFSLTLPALENAMDAVRHAVAGAAATPPPSPIKAIEIPVCYDRSSAPDLADVARFHRCEISDVIRLHTQPVYTVQFVGFSPGFGYLSGLPMQLETPRLDTPRVRVPAGSVGIAEKQTGIYPSATPGGWRLIGRTPFIMFDAQRDKPSLLSAGDRIRFVPIDLATFNAQMRNRADHE